MQENLQEMIDNLPELVVTYGTKILLALVIFFIGKAVAGWIKSFIGKTLTKRGVDPTIASFTKHIAYYVMMVIIVVAALGQIGVQTASFVAVIGAAGLAIGLALQGSLSNFAAGVMLIVLRPFKGGDYIEAGGTAGSVSEVHIFTTTLISPDNRTIIVPNSQILSDTIVNYSTQTQRRLDLVFGVSYNSDLDKVRSEIKAVIEADERVIKEKDVTIAILELADSSINFAVRPWVPSSDYWPCRFELTEKIKKRFDEVGIEIPFPQMDVHMDKPEAA